MTLATGLHAVRWTVGVRTYSAARRATARVTLAENIAKNTHTLWWESKPEKNEEVNRVHVGWTTLVLCVAVLLIQN